jgi:hypothetical protein
MPRGLGPLDPRRQPLQIRSNESGSRGSSQHSGDAAAPKAIEADRRPPTLVAAEYGRAFSENSNVIAVADQITVSIPS